MSSTFVAYLTVGNYLLLTLLWSAIVVLYLRSRRLARSVDPLVATLAAVLALDATKSAIESAYFGVVWASEYEIALTALGAILARPEMLIAPKILNLVTAVTVLAVIVRRWIPRELRERRERAESDARLRRELEASLADVRAAEERWDLAIRANQDGIWDWDLTTNRVWISPRLEEQLGYAHGELAPRFGPEIWKDLVHEEDAEQLGAAREAFVRGTTRDFDVEVRLRCKAGDHRTFRARAAAQRAPSGEALRVVGSLSDVTEQRRVEASLARRRSIERLGLVASGVAHDVNNLLAVVRANVELARTTTSSDSRVAAALADIDDAVTRGATLTSRLLASTGRGRFAVTEVDVGALAQEMTRLLAGSAPRAVRIETAISRPVPTVEADAAQVQQVVMNLVTNAIEAVDPEHGKVRVSVRAEAVREPVPAAVADEAALPPGRYVVLEVDDDGVGMSDAVRAQMFEPFFTTKPEGRGLGLAAMLSTLRAHRAGLRLRSAPGQGTTFTVLFPASERASQEARPPRDIRARRSRCALIVDDDESVRTAVSRMTELLGLEPRVVGSGAAALDVLDEHGELAVVLLDLRMPGGFDGHDVLLRIRERRPELRVVMMSGFHKFVPMSDARTTALQKPFSMEQLRDALARVGVEVGPFEAANEAPRGA
ncbi:hybrid sensor histidine kinase/response regulator [Sandaracinus amylolyticus]|uniref:hybrid sensor histidine kinase/response regulator n=1 Tax=Sandaracinus amylolyticus TaxID=927083 RepID=UPI001F1EFB3A|nr:PAS domain-containing sensor histidine kinase [Sandaracinus amylolyticus]UJR81591.1 Multi-sensor hybrid histidine kinase [Sandaracinus amylolyticus]